MRCLVWTRAAAVAGCFLVSACADTSGPPPPPEPCEDTQIPEQWVGQYNMSGVYRDCTTGEVLDEWTESVSFCSGQPFLPPGEGERTILECSLEQSGDSYTAHVVWEESFLNDCRMRMTMDSEGSFSDGTIQGSGSLSMQPVDGCPDAGPICFTVETSGVRTGPAQDCSQPR